MVLIPFKSQYVSLFVTFVSGAAEIALLFAALRYNTFFECVKLRRGGKINIRRHRRRTKFLAVLATMAFIILEAFNSFFSDPAQTFTLENMPCTSVDPLTVSQGVTGYLEPTDVVLLKCLDVNQTHVNLHSGFISTEDGSRFQCNDPILRFERTVPPDEVLPDSGVVYECGKHPLDPDEDIYLHCVFVYINGSEVTFTHTMGREFVEPVIAEKPLLRVFKTEVMYNASGMERMFAKRAAFAFAVVVTDDVALRREIFTGEGSGNCDFRIPRDATEMSLGLIYALAGAWMASFLTLLSTVFLKHGIFYDVSDPLHWAQKTVVDRNLVDANNPVIATSDIPGGRTVVVSNSSHEYNSLQMNVPHLFRRRREKSSGSGEQKTENTTAAAANDQHERGQSLYYV